MNDTTKTTYGLFLICRHILKIPDSDGETVTVPLSSLEAGVADGSRAGKPAFSLVSEYPSSISGLKETLE